VQLPENKSWRLIAGMEGWASILSFIFGRTRTAEFVSTKRRPHCTSKEIPWCSFLLQAEWTPGLLNADRRISHLKISKELTGKRTRNLPSYGVVPQPTNKSCVWRRTSAICLSLY
jgi:hypothetical protein